MLCFVVGVGGGLLLRKTKTGKTASSNAGANPGKRQAGSTANGKSRQPQPDLVARKAAEQLFGPLFRRGYQNFRAERYSEAVRDFERATEVAPHLAEGHYYLGEAYSKLFLLAKAEAAYRTALERMSDFRDAQEKLAMLLYRRGAYREAIALLKTMAPVDSDDPFVVSELAINYIALGEPDAAIPLLKKFNAIRGRQASGYAHLGRAYELSGDLAQAEQHYREALTIDPHFSLANHWLGLLLARTDRQDEAAPLLAMYDRLRKLETTEHELSMALLQKQDDVQGLAKLAETRFQLGKYDAAAQTLQRAERLAPGDARLAALRKKWGVYLRRSQTP
jgi:tetratricopeptide (TPR) repeat protein